MSYDLAYHVIDDVPTVALRGTKRVDTALEIATRMRAIIRENRLERMLVIDEMQDELTVWDAVDIEAFFVAHGFSRATRVAIVDSRAGQERNSNAFIGLFLRNRGWHRIRVFVDRSDAVAWLGETHPAPCLPGPPVAASTASSTRA